MFCLFSVLQSLSVVFSGSFLAAAAFNADPMLPEIYGRAVDYPAVAWASWFLLGHVAAMFGLWNNLRLLAFSGLLLVFPAYLFLAVFAQPAAYGSVITLHSFLVGAMSQLVMMWAVLMYWDRR